MGLADEIEDLVRRNSGLSEIDLARLLPGPVYQQQVNSACRRLVAEGRLERQGKGGWQHPFTYYPPRIKWRRRRKDEKKQVGQLGPTARSP